jgi:hypothetical protein
MTTFETMCQIVWRAIRRIDLTQCVASIADHLVGGSRKLLAMSKLNWHTTSATFLRKTGVEYSLLGSFRI